MPIYEYECRSCGEAFELLVRGSTAPACPTCQSSELEKLLSLPTMSSEGSRRRSFAEAKKKGRAAAQEKAAAEEAAHHHDH